MQSSGRRHRIASPRSRITPGAPNATPSTLQRSAHFTMLSKIDNRVTTLTRTARPHPARTVHRAPQNPPSRHTDAARAPTAPPAFTTLSKIDNRVTPRVRTSPNPAPPSAAYFTTLFKIDNRITTDAPNLRRQPDSRTRPLHRALQNRRSRHNCHSEPPGPAPLPTRTVHDALQNRQSRHTAALRTLEIAYIQ